jgi:hypothetical protein
MSSDVDASYINRGCVAFIDTEGTLDELISKLNDVRSIYIGEGILLKYAVSGDYEDGHEINIIKYVKETEAQKELRLKKEEEWQARCLVERKKQYEELKKEFEKQ